MNTLILAQGIFDLGNDLANETSALMKTVLVIIGVIIGCVIIFKNPSFGRVISGVCVGGFIAGLPWIIPAVSQMFQSDIEATSIVQERVIEPQDHTDELEL